MSPAWLWNVRLLDGGQARMAVELAGEKIGAVVPVAGTPPPGALDLAGKTLLPGLIDAHCHFTSDLKRSPGFGPPPPLAGESPRPSALGYFILAAAAREMLASGFTTIRDVGCYDDEAIVARTAIDLGVVPGPRVWACGRIISATAPGGETFGSMYREADGPWEMRKAVREQIRRGADFIKFMATGARSVEREDPEPAQMTTEEMEAVVDEAHRMGLRVAAHAEGLAGARAALQAGADTIEHGLSLHRDPALLDRMAAAGTVLVPTLSTFHDLAERFAADFAPRLVSQAQRQLEEARLTVAAARAAGVTMAVGYDSGPPGSSAMEIKRLAEAGLSELEAITAATAGGAAALGRSDLGRVTPGALADLVVVNGDPLSDLGVLTDRSRIAMVFRGGRLAL
jgi:imidazolonepropionase-like amidohydrolase